MAAEQNGNILLCFDKFLKIFLQTPNKLLLPKYLSKNISKSFNLILIKLDMSLETCSIKASIKTSKVQFLYI